MRSTGPRAPGAAGRAVAVSVAVALAVFGSFLLLVTPEFADRPGLQTLWVVISLVLLKLPLLGLVWWLITRRRRTRLPEWDAARAERHLVELSAEAERLAGTPGSAGRLEALSAEAWRTAERAHPSVTPAAVDLALRLDRLRRRDGTAAGRPSQPSGEKLPK